VRTNKFLIAASVAASIALLGAGCASSTPAADDDSSAAPAGEIVTVKVGATAPADEILQYAQDSGQAEAAGIKIEVTAFTDYTTPNTSLADGSTDANLYQHFPFLTKFNEENGTDLVAVGKVYFPALALYSTKIGGVDEIKEGDTISVPNDPTNELRAFNLLEAAGLITVQEGATEGVLSDIAENPLNLKFQELDAATLPRALDDNPAGIVNLTFALPAGLTADEQIFKEDVEGTPYTNLLATTAGHENDESIQALYSVLTSDETQAWITDYFKGLVTPASGPAE
jgi:D-methionine transport system substrate-binding protein